MKVTSRVLALAALVAAAPAGAVEYGKVLPEKSEIRFVSRQMNVPVEGSFRKFDVQLSFDPAKPESGSTRITVHLAGIDAGSDEANAEARTKGWFDTPRFPTATFASTRVKPLGPNRYEVAGTLTIKGRSRDVVAPVSFRQDGANAVLEGSFVVKRLQFAIGEGPWSDVETVADDVQVRFRVTASPVK
ncbi:MAG TPA: YceI family protein [Burkholderiales bacterium]|nr:YceI family protein [Burkholderiales bacterium]